MDRASGAAGREEIAGGSFFAREYLSQRRKDTKKEQEEMSRRSTVAGVDLRYLLVLSLRLCAFARDIRSQKKRSEGFRDRKSVAEGKSGVSRCERITHG